MRYELVEHCDGQNGRVVKGRVGDGPRVPLVFSTLADAKAALALYNELQRAGHLSVCIEPVD